MVGSHWTLSAAALVMFAQAAECPSEEPRFPQGQYYVGPIYYYPLEGGSNPPVALLYAFTWDADSVPQGGRSDAAAGGDYAGVLFAQIYDSFHDFENDLAYSCLLRDDLVATGVTPSATGVDPATCVGCESFARVVTSYASREGAGCTEDKLVWYYGTSNPALAQPHRVAWGYRHAETAGWPEEATYYSAQLEAAGFEGALYEGEGEAFEAKYFVAPVDLDEAPRGGQRWRGGAPALVAADLAALPLAPFAPR